MIEDDLARAPRRLFTRRLRLETPRIEHAEAVMASINASLPDLRFVAWAQRAVDLVWAQSFTRRGERFVDEGDALIYYAFERETGAFAGNLDLHHFEFEVPRCQIGYVADSRHAGRGLMHEAAGAVVDVAFSLGFLRIEAHSDIENRRAIRFALGLGFREEGVLHAYERDEQGSLRDVVLLARLHPSLVRAV